MSDGQDRDGWWEASLTRRQAGGALVVGTAAITGLGACCESSDPIAEHDAIELQKKQGWDVGDRGKTLLFNGTTTKDSKGDDGWKALVASEKLLDAARPSQEKWEKFQRAVLFQSLDQSSLAAQIKPISTPKMNEAHARGKALVSLITSVKDPAGTLLILDMPGPQSVALAAGMADRVDPVFVFDNWPHPQGVVRSHETLAATLFYGRALEEARRARADKAVPTALVLDSQRLTPYKDDSDAFDNRYYVELPDATTLKGLGISRVLYVTAKSVKTELDDLNEPMAALVDAKIKVAKVALSDFQKDPSAPAESAAATGGYFYGGGYHHHPHFFSFYPMFLFLPIRSYGFSSRSVAPNARRFPKPGYKPTRRPTVFSSRTTGASKGVGRRKPTGFGRVSTRTNSAGKTTRVNRSTATRTGSRPPTKRSGSYGRSRGGGFG